jgi:hypothetical protein
MTEFEPAIDWKHFIAALKRRQPTPGNQALDMELQCRFTGKRWYCSCDWFCDCDRCPGDEEWQDCVCLLDDDE